MKEICETSGLSIEECPMCQGESCLMCGAGSWSSVDDCEHDTIDRHFYPQINHQEETM